MSSFGLDCNAEIVAGLELHLHTYRNRIGIQMDDITRRRQILIAACVAAVAICTQYVTLLVSLVEEEEDEATS